jgi:hypothetical protein
VGITVDGSGAEKQQNLLDPHREDGQPFLDDDGCRFAKDFPDLV